MIMETVVHFLFECQTYTVECYDMDRALGHYTRDLQSILASLGSIKELLTLVGRMVRFSNMLGDSIRVFHGSTTCGPTLIPTLIPILQSWKSEVKPLFSGWDPNQCHNHNLDPTNSVSQLHSPSYLPTSDHGTRHD